MTSVASRFANGLTKTMFHASACCDVPGNIG